ncbi:ATP-binding protein [Lamprobacter modestohalophilus]|uniref:sensor histidine kinase n=1 Tax=Lamprobacter modestohalophilus TaxID=1064514 RepID=UPI002ADEBE4F|nr:ATP-binding protein [Lamprobacter modestohalophilus]MEA1048670.1 ATP-binding protein [Lamprobacter modestohalophilus]
MSKSSRRVLLFRLLTLLAVAWIQVWSPAHAEPAFSDVFRDHAATMLLVDPASGAIRDANAAAVRFYGYPRERLLAMRIQDISTLAPLRVNEEMERAQSGERAHFVFRHRLASGEERKVAVWSSPLNIDGKIQLLSIISDLTVMREANDPFWHYQSGLEDKVDLQSSQIAAYVAERREQDRRTILVLFIGVMALLLLSAKLARDVRRRRQAEATAKQLLEKNAQANGALQRFTEVAAHHLQEPCRRMASYAGLIRRRLERGAQLDELEPLALTLETQAIRQRTLVRDMQLYLAAGQASAQQGVDDPAALTRELFATLADQHSQAPVTLSVAEMPRIPLDRQWLSYCLRCLLENAIEHADPEQPVEIQVFTRAAVGGLQLLVADNGPGIPAPYRERVFGVFEQLSPPILATRTGIGLAIVRRIMETVGGRAMAEETPGGGTTIVLDFTREDLSS